MNIRTILAVVAVAGLAGHQDRPSIFAAGSVSTEAPEFAVTFSPDGREAFFNRTSADRRTMVIMTSRRTDGRWSDPIPAPFSGASLDIDPFLAPDGTRLYFSSNRPRASGKPGDFNTWYVERTAGGWSAPVDPGPPLNSDSSEVFVSLAKDGTIVFTSNRSGVARVYLARRTSTGWTAPEAIAFGALSGWSNPMIDPDGRFVVLVAAGPDDRADLHLSCRRGTEWGDPIRLPNVNSRWADFAPAFGPSGRLYFTSERPGLIGAVADSVRPPGDIYSAELPRLCP